jgi:hypothetical protein
MLAAFGIATASARRRGGCREPGGCHRTPGRTARAYPRGGSVPATACLRATSRLASACGTRRTPGPGPAEVRTPVVRNTGTSGSGSGCLLTGPAPPAARSRPATAGRAAAWPGRRVPPAWPSRCRCRAGVAAEQILGGRLVRGRVAVQAPLVIEGAGQLDRASRDLRGLRVRVVIGQAHRQHVQGAGVDPGAGQVDAAVGAGRAGRAR